jgi:hypothetical protein
MPYVSPAASKPTTKVSRLTAAVRRTWAEARYADRQLMAMRTELSRHSGHSG